MLQDPAEERSPAAPTNSPVSAMEASQADANAETKETPFWLRKQSGQQPSRWHHQTRQTVWKEALSDGQGPDPKGNQAHQGKGDTT